MWAKVFKVDRAVLLNILNISKVPPTLMHGNHQGKSRAIQVSDFGTLDLVIMVVH